MTHRAHLLRTTSRLAIANHWLSHFDSAEVTDAQGRRYRLHYFWGRIVGREAL